MPNDTEPSFENPRITHVSDETVVEQSRIFMSGLIGCVSACTRRACRSTNSCMGTGPGDGPICASAVWTGQLEEIARGLLAFYRAVRALEPPYDFGADAARARRELETLIDRHMAARAREESGNTSRHR